MNFNSLRLSWSSFWVAVGRIVVDSSSLSSCCGEALQVVTCHSQCLADADRDEAFSHESKLNMSCDLSSRLPSTITTSESYESYQLSYLCQQLPAHWHTDNPGKRQTLWLQIATHIFTHIFTSRKYFRCSFIGIQTDNKSVSPLTWMTR